MSACCFPKAGAVASLLRGGAFPFCGAGRKGPPIIANPSLRRILEHMERKIEGQAGINTSLDVVQRSVVNATQVEVGEFEVQPHLLGVCRDRWKKAVDECWSIWKEELSIK